MSNVLTEAKKKQVYETTMQELEAGQPLEVKLISQIALIQPDQQVSILAQILENQKPTSDVDRTKLAVANNNYANVVNRLIVGYQATPDMRAKIANAAVAALNTEVLRVVCKSPNFDPSHRQTFDRSHVPSNKAVPKSPLESALTEIRISTDSDEVSEHKAAHACLDLLLQTNLKAHPQDRNKSVTKPVCHANAADVESQTTPHTAGGTSVGMNK